jgi:hypothetical protein
MSRIVVCLVFLFLLCIKIPLAVAQAGETTLKPTDDTYADSDKPYSLGDQTDFIIDYYQWFNMTVESMIWLKFNLSSIPDEAIVDNATVHLHKNGEVMVRPAAMTSFEVSAHSCSNETWTEQTLTYYNMPSYNTTSMDSETVGFSVGWYNWSVLDAVRTALNNTAKTVTIVLEPSYDFYQPIAFDSKEAPIVNSTDYAPELTVHWSSVVPEFPSFLILPLFFITTLLATIFFRKRLTRS